jgi:catechol 2,3-dioxygenase-like lactoylglutathione lyase family enzyme
MGFDCWTKPEQLDFGSFKGEVFVASDPDGTQIEFVRGNELRLSHVAVNVTDLARSSDFYQRIMGLQLVLDLSPPPLPGRVFRLEGDVRLHAHLLRDETSGFAVELIQWLTPPARRWGFRKANELGIFRMAWLTHSIDADYQALLRAGACCYSAPAALSMGPGIPDLRALFFDDPDAVCLELIETGAPS